MRIITNCLFMTVCIFFLSCKATCRRTELKAHEDMSYLIEYSNDSIIISVKEQDKETKYIAVKKDGEYYDKDGLFLSTVRDTVIQDSTGLLHTTTSIRKIKEHDTWAYLLDRYDKDLYVTDTRFVNEVSPKDGAWPLTTYIYDKDYNIIQIGRFMYATFE